MNRLVDARRLAVVSLLAVCAAVAGAQMPPGMGGNCMMDQLTKLCPDAKPGTPEFSACSKEHVADAMGACQGQMQPATPAAPAATPKSPCASDVKTYCPGRRPGTPEFSACMKKHQGDLSPACAAYAKKRMAQGSTPGSDVCVSDAKKYCPGLTVMDGNKFGACMTKHYDSLSPTCQKHFKVLDKHDAQGACQAAMVKLCPDAAPGSPEMTQCMMAHHDELAGPCHKQ
jgi:hypothetical protein